MAMAKKVLPRKKKMASSFVRKPPTIGHGGVIQRGSGVALGARPPNKRYKRQKFQVNTISHDEDQTGPNARLGLEMANFAQNRS